MCGCISDCILKCMRVCLCHCGFPFHNCIKALKPNGRKVVGLLGVLHLIRNKKPKLWKEEKLKQN